MNAPELKWGETGTAGELETLLLNVGGAIDQSCGRCRNVMDGSEDNWGMVLTADTIGVITFQAEFFCPKCLEGYLVNRNRVGECRADGVRDPGACATEKGRQEGEDDHK